MNFFSGYRHRVGWLPLLASLAAAAPMNHGSGTRLILQRMQELRAQGKPMALAKTASLSLSGRVYRTTHFAFHYTLAPNVHRPLFTPQDSSLLRQINTILKSLPTSLSTYARDSTLNTAFSDSVAPLFVQRAAYHFEHYWSYFADTLGMDMPTGGSSSLEFVGPSDGNRYTVDICDIGTAQPDYIGAIYGLTWPQPAISTMLENDFVWHSFSLNGGVVSEVDSGPIQAVVNGQVLHDYTIDWDMGIEVTAIHEFYHGIQFNYVSSDNYNDWYELSSTGMEEALAPEVNDYFQYLPCLFQNHDKIPLIQSDNGVCNFPPEFGFGVFHQYLSYTLGKKFDVVLWSALRSNGNDLAAALQATAAHYGVSWDSLYAGFTAALAPAGRGAASNCTDSVAPIFLRDRPCWPVPGFTVLPSLNDSIAAAVPALTFQLFHPPTTGTTVSISLSGLIGSLPQKVSQSVSSYSAETVIGNPLIFFPSSDSSVLCLSIPNSSFTTAGSLTAITSATGSGFTVFPNPARLTAGDVFFALPSGLSGPLTLTIVSETGRRVASLPLNAQTSLWTWNLEDEQGRAVPPGIYFYSIPGQAPETLPLLPH